MADWQSAPAVSGPGTPSQDSTPQWQSAPAVDNATPAWKSAPPAEPNVPNVSEILRQQTTPAGQEPTWKTAADAHIQSLESGHDWVKQPDGTWIKQQVRQPGPLSTSEKLATYYAYQNQQGYGQTPMQEPGQAMAQDRAQTQQAIVSGQSDYQNFANAADQSLAGFGTNVVGAFNPQLGQQLQQNVQAAAPFNPESRGGTVGSITGQVLPLIPAMVSGQGPAATMTQLGTAGAAGAGQFGAVREDVANRRSQGQQISKLQEFGNAGLQAATMFLANKFGMGQLNKGLPALTAAERASLQTVVAQHVATAMQNAGVTGSDFAAMQMANNIIDRVTGVAPDKDITEGVGQALGAGIATGGIATGLHAMNHPTSIQEGVPVPSQQTLDSLKITPPKDVTSGQGNTKPTEPNAPIQSQAADKTPPPAAATPDTGRASGTTGRTLIDAAEPTYRVHNGAESQGVPLEFESPEEKALFLATVPRKGKVANEAIAFLQERGFKPEAITRYGDELRSRLDGLAKQPPAEGHPLYVPMLGDAEATPTKAPGLPQEQGAVNEQPTAPPLTPEKDHAAILAERNPGAKLADIPNLPDEHKQVLSDYKQLTGKDMVPYNGGKGRGFHLDGDAYYSVDRNNTPQRRRETIAHEATHALQDTQPQLVASLDRALPDSMRQSLLSEYQENYKHQEGKPLSTDQHNREIQAMAVGRAFARPSVAKAVMNKNPGAFSKAAGAVIRTLRNLTKTGRATNEIVSFLQQAKAKADAIEQPATRRMPEKEVANYLPQHSQDLRDQAEEYTTKAGLPYEPDHEYAKVDEDRAKRIAAEYSSLKHEPGNPDVKRSYDAFKHETLDQWNYLKDKGVKFEAWQKPGQPYKNSEEMSNDVRNNQHLYFFQGGDLPQDHPLADNAPGTPYTYNDVFRAVHDYFGHAKEGYGFGPRGEENAWRSHSQMYSEAARPAMTTETRGQNSWVNFGPHGEANQKNPADTTYAEQKAGLLPRQFQQLESAAPAYPGRSAAEESLGSYAKDKAGFNQPSMAGSYLPDYKPKNKENQKNLEELKTHLTPEEYDSLNTPEAKRAVELLKTLPPDKEFAEAIKAGRAKQGWYEKATATINSLFGPDAKQFARLLAATSPRQSVLNNFRESLAIWDAWDKAGRPTDPQKIEDIVLHQPDKLLGLSTRLPNVQRALTESGPLSGYKVNSFMQNLQGDLSKVTNDTWMAQFGGLDQKVFADNGGYLGFTAKVRRVADKVGVKPAEAQEMIWSFFKTLAENVNAKTTGRDALLNLKHEDIANTPAFADMLNDPEISNGLKQLGIPQDAIERATAAGKAAGPEQSARGYVTESDKGVLGRIAERAEGLAKNKPAESTKSQQPLFLPGSGAAKSFIDEDVKPVLKAVGERFSDAWDGVKSVFAPQARSEQAGQAARLMRERGGYLARQMDRVHAAFDETEKALDKLPVDQQRAITDAAERGLKQADPALQPVADAIRQMYDDRLASLKRLNPSFDGLNDYMGHLYKDPAKATAVLNTLGRTPLEGNKGFLRQRTIPYQSDAIAKGLEPVTDNPVSMMKLKLGQMDKYIATQDTFDQMKANGLLKRVPARKLFEEKQNGYEQIDDKVGTIFAKPNRKGGVSIAGYWMAPEPVARVINNYLSPGIRGNQSVGGLYQTYLGVGHALNSVQLLSGFHLMFSTIDTMASKLGLGFRQAWGGDFKGAAKSTASWATLIHPVIDAYRNGNAMMKEWYKPGSTGKPDIAQAVDNYMIAGGRMHMGRDEYPSFTQSMKDAAAKGNYVGAAARSPLAAIEQISKPLMEHLIPRLKAGVFYDMAMHEIQNLPPTATRDAVRKVMSEAQDSVDDRLGEMVYDNTFWHHTAKDLLMATTRSVGWNAGTFRTFGGAAIDLAKLPGAIASNKGLQGVRLSNRLAYAAAVPLTTALVGSIMHYAATGQPPQTLKDAIFPKTGKKTKQGDDERWAIPSYVKDLAEYGRDISDAVTQKQPTKLFRTLGNKTNPVLNTMLAMLQNHDYYGVKIRNEDDPAIQQLKDVGSYLGKQVEPFGIRGVQQMLQEGQGARSILPLIGLNPARKDVTESPAALRASELVQDRLPHGLRTKEQAEKSRTIGELASAVGRKEPDAAAKVRAAVEGKQITPDDFSTIRSRSKFGSTIERNVHALASRGHLDSAMQVWDIADDTERRKLLPILTQAVRGAKSAPIEERKQYMATLMAEAKRLKAALPPATAEE